MVKLRALIVDDEVHARENLSYLLINYCPQIEVAGMAADPAGAKQLVALHDPQLIFLDICMPSGTEGFEFLDSIPDKKFQVIFVTAFKESAIRALNVNAIHYLQKPVDVDDLQMAVEKVLKTHQLFAENREQLSNYIRSLNNLSAALLPGERAPRITISHNNGFKIAEQNELMLLEALGHNTAVTFSDGSRYVDSRSLNIYEDMLEPTRFFRIHKSFIVNISHIKAFINDSE